MNDPASRKLPVERGRLFLITGNSGSGKDTLLSEISKRWPENLPSLRVPRRYITRPAHDSEPFIPLTDEEFETKLVNGEFGLSWDSYQLRYGVSSDIFDWLERGESVAVNVSREIISKVRRQVPDVRVVFIRVPWEITLKRLIARGREYTNDPGFKMRLERARRNTDCFEADCVIFNSGVLENSAKSLLSYMVSAVFQPGRVNGSVFPFQGDDS